MEIKIEDIKELFVRIGKESIDESMDNLVDVGIVDSITIMNLIGEIENKYNVEVDFDYMIPENFKNFNIIKKMIEDILKNQ